MREVEDENLQLLLEPYPGMFDFYCALRKRAWHHEEDTAYLTDAFGVMMVKMLQAQDPDGEYFAITSGSKRRAH